MKNMMIVLFSIGIFYCYSLLSVSPASGNHRLQNESIALNKPVKQIAEYNKPLTENDKQNVNYIINTLSSRSMFGLFAVKSKLEQVGEKTENINPLRHLQYIFSNPDLKAKTKKIGNVPWNRYVRDFGNSLNLAAQQGKINDQILKEFANKVGISYEVLKPLADNHEWTKFINTLRDSN